jgi:DNA-binding response OmpR family regulator
VTPIASLGQSVSRRQNAARLERLPFTGTVSRETDRPARILVVDDEPRYREIIRFNLEAAGYDVTTAGSGEEALDAFGRQERSLILLDVMLPGIDGFEVLRRIRDRSSTPVIMLTAKGAEEDKVQGLRLGADDYVTKPFSAQELLARVEAVLRRAQPTQRDDRIEIGDLRIDQAQKQVTLAGRDLRLSPTEYRLLVHMAEQAGVVLSRDELLTHVWGEAYKGEDEILRVTLWRLRQKLADDPSAPRYVVTRPGLGYMLAKP